jgi:hypothetical protein
MIVDLNQPNLKDKPVGMHHNPVTEQEFFWTGKVAIGIACPAHQPYFSVMPRHERQVLAAALKEGK